MARNSDFLVINARAMKILDYYDGKGLFPKKADGGSGIVPFGKSKVPEELIKAYVAGKLCDRMCKFFEKLARVEWDDVDVFLENVKCPGAGTFHKASGLPPIAFCRAVDRAVAENFDIAPGDLYKKGGPYYLLNLLSDAKVELRYRYQRVSEMRICTAKQQRLEEIKIIFERVVYHEHIFSNIRMVLYEMSTHMEKGAQILTDPQLFHAYCRSNYAGDPIVYDGADIEKMICTDLERKIYNVKMGVLCADFVKEIMEHRTQWAEYQPSEYKHTEPRFEAPARICEFWKRWVS